tara:strand:+ start:3071 stop:4153 length:1083 start_codon:yes stop_codon:yes gene_type:complete
VGGYLKLLYQRYLSDNQAVILALFLVGSLLVLALIGDMLAPVIASVIIAYLLEGLVKRLQQIKCPHILAVIVVFLLFLGILLLLLFVFLPLFMQQLTNFFAEWPIMVNRAQLLIGQLSERYPEYISAKHIKSFMMEFKSDFARVGQMVLSYSISTIPSLLVLVVYLILVPLLVFFFLMDKDKIIAWTERYLPKNRTVLQRIWQEVDAEIGNYIRGKVIEILIVAVVTYVAFVLLRMPYAMLLAVLVGLSVLIPYIGVTVVTIPVTIVAFLQWGWSSHFAYLMIVYTIICILDANLLVPLLFSEAVSLHPVAIIVAILIFGGIWGFWGIFFAIPLASLVKAILNAWPVAEPTSAHDVSGQV